MKNIIIALAALVIVGIAGSSSLRRNGRARLLQAYSELSEILVDKDLSGCDIDAFRDALQQVQLLFSRGAVGEAEELLKTLIGQARALQPPGDPEPLTPAPTPRTFEPTAFPAEADIRIPFYSRPDADFQIEQTYFVAQNASGASNNNDGRSETFEGGTRGPFKDFNSAHVRATLVGARSGVRVVVREGVYRIEDLGEGGIRLDGRGDEFHPTVLTGALGERVVLVPAASLGTREPILVTGRHGIVENLFVKRIGNKYNLLVVGNATIIRHNVFEGPWMEDAIKIGADARHCLIFDNDISDHGSQAVDSFGNDILIKENRVHHSAGANGMGFGTKGGTRNHVYVDNVLHDLSRGLGGGGTGDLELYRRAESGELLHAAFNVTMLRNTLYNIDGIVVTFESCKGCSFNSNRVYDSKGGYQVGINPDVFVGPYRDLATGLPASEGIVIRDNRFANLTSGFVGLVEGRSRRAFVSEGNIYYTDSKLVFAYREKKFEKLTQAQFRATLDTDHSSAIRPLSEFAR